jgi:DnaJ-class molecular chaperone
MDIKHMKEHQPEKYQKAGFKMCGHCNGTGIQDKDINRACKNCVGVGFVGHKELDDETICPACNGTGFEIRYSNDVQDCSTCDGFGRLTWVEAVMKGISMEKLW